MTKSLSRKLDLNLLDLFSTVYKTRNLTEAGKQLGLSQPAMSHALSRLREMYDDPLFLRQAKGVQPTPFAESLVSPVSEALQILEQTLRKEQFDPSTSNRVFRLAMTDIGEQTFLPKLVNALNEQAPFIRIESVATSTTTAELADALSQGRIDMALGAIEKVGAGIRQQVLFSDYYVCVARNGINPQVMQERSAFLRAKHVVPDVAGTVHSSLIQKFLENHTIGRQAMVRVTHFLAIAELVSKTDLIAIMPRNLALNVEQRWDIQHFTPPVPIPAYEVALCWHQRHSNEPGHRWLRELIRQLFAASNPEAAARRRAQHKRPE